ncbi:MAG: hypothetical protein M1837_000519 [Sclerophora amabilis]|nr:MAG: hypothetical protein M1837_000519 [Sclerophora amabilis]
MASQQSSVFRYRPCESYFVDSHQEGDTGARAGILERIRLTAEERQYAMAEELSRLASDELLDDVLEHMDTMEGETLPDVASIDIQTEIQWFMRPYLLDFLIEAHTSFKLLPETLFLAVNLLDRYCSRRIVYKRHYQLVGCASLLIASKYGDVKENIPSVRELKTMCCALYDDDMFTQMEWHVLQTLNWTVGSPTVDGFLKIALLDAPFDPHVEHMALYISEIALFAKDFVSTRPSVMARSSLALARCILGRSNSTCDGWAADYDSFTMVNLSQQLHRPSPIVSRKYASPHLSAVALIMEEFLARQAFITRNYAPLSPAGETSAVQQKPDGGATYLTPQKGQYSGMPYGVPTPPITPEGNLYNAETDGKDYPPPSACPPTPCPMPTEIQQHAFACGL